MATKSSKRDLDVVVFGGTGFAGRLVAQYLADHGPKGVRIGLAGRSQEKLAHIRNQLGPAAESWPLLVADSANPASLSTIAARTRVVATTVGPYRQHGINLVEACVNAGTDYADLTGEVLFMRDSIDRYHDAAASRGVRIVHSCGFDSIPSDLGVLLLHQEAAAHGAGDLEDTTLVVTELKGGPSGGTLASGKLQADEARADPKVAKLIADPYALSPDRAEEPDLGDERDQAWINHDANLRTWTAPFVMAGINTRVVRRSNALLGWHTAADFDIARSWASATDPSAPPRRPRSVPRWQAFGPGSGSVPPGHSWSGRCRRPARVPVRKPAERAGIGSRSMPAHPTARVTWPVPRRRATRKMRPPR